jgi:transcriptional regulator with XRE-family HTH domain
MGTDLGKNVKRLRKARGLTQAKLAERVAVQRQTIIKIEQGKTVASHQTIVDIAKELGETVDALQGPPPGTRGVVSPDSLRLAAMLDELEEDEYRAMRHVIEKLYAARRAARG